MHSRTGEINRISGFTLVEILVVTIILVAGLSTAIFVLSSSKPVHESIAVAGGLEDGWQRFMLQVREDLRSAQTVKMTQEKLHVVFAQMQQESMNVNMHEVIYFLDNSGNLVRQHVGGSEKKIMFSGQISSLKSNLWFTINGSESVRIKINVVDTAVEKPVFNREELVAIANTKQQ